MLGCLSIFWFTLWYENVSVTRPVATEMCLLITALLAFLEVKKKDDWFLLFNFMLLWYNSLSTKQLLVGGVKFVFRMEKSKICFGNDNCWKVVQYHFPLFRLDWLEAFKRFSQSLEDCMGIWASVLIRLSQKDGTGDQFMKFAPEKLTHSFLWNNFYRSISFLRPSFVRATLTCSKMWKAHWTEHNF